MIASGKFVRAGCAMVRGGRTVVCAFRCLTSISMVDADVVDEALLYFT